MLEFQQFLTQDSRQSLNFWLAYFQNNHHSLLALPWEESNSLTHAEKVIIATSIRKFQLGESSEGCHLMKVTREFAKQSGDLTLIEIMKLFIGEEQRHARDLGRFMAKEQIQLASQDWTDHIFRRVRKLAGLELAISVLLIAELVATVYYKALGNATRSHLLQQLCCQIQADEVQHTYFQAYLLACIRQNRFWLLTYLSSFFHAGFYSLSLILIWFDHRSVLIAGGYNFKRFWQESQQVFKAVLKF